MPIIAGAYPGETGSMIRLKLCVFWLSIRQVASAKVILFIMEMCWAEIRYGIRLIRVNMILSFWPEPHNTIVKAVLDNITDYDALKSISYPAEFFDSERVIPMIAENNSIKVLADGTWR